MLKNIKKIIVMALILIAMLLLTNAVCAREISNTEELGKAIQEVNPNAESAYIIGNYVFTTARKLTVQDVMLAARSIKLTENAEQQEKIDSQPSYGEMTIHKVEAEYAEDGTINKWKIADNLLGDTTLEIDETKKLDIRYIDYKFIAEESKATISIDKIDEEGGEYKNNLQYLDFEGGNNKWSKNLKLDGEILTGLLLKKDTMTAFGEDDAKGYYFAFVVEVPDAKEGTTVTIKGPNHTTKATYDDFDIKNGESKTPGLLVLFAVDPDTNKDQMNIKITVDVDGEKVEYSPNTMTIDYSKLTFQQDTKADINIVGSETDADIPESDKTQLEEWGYTFPDDIELSDDNENIPEGGSELKYDYETGLLTGLLKEQKLTGGFGEDALDSYFYTFTIKPEEVTEDIKVKIENGKGDNVKEFNFSDFTEDNGKYVLTILQHIPTTVQKCDDSCECCKGGSGCTGAKDCKCEKSLKITIDSDGADKDDYRESEVYYLDYCNVDFVKLHTVRFNNNDGELILAKDVYNGEKLQKPTDPTWEKDSKDEHQYNTFSYWRTEGDDYTEDQEFKFEGEESEKTIDKDLALYPIWDIDVDQYVSDALIYINDKENVKNNFQIEKKDDSTLKVEIKNREAKIEEITDTAIASTIAHALASGEIDTINIESDDEKNDSVEFVYSSLKEEIKEETDAESKIKEKVTEGLKELINEKILKDSENKTLDELTKKCSQGSELKIEIVPEKSIAKVKGTEIGNESEKIYHFEFEEDAVISFDAGPIENPEDVYVVDGKIEGELPTPTIPEKEQDFREFAGWYTETGEEFNKEDTISEDMKLTAHYNLYVDKFIAKIIEDLNNSEDTTYSDDFSKKFILTQGEDKKNEITINIKNPNVPLGELAKTSIPGTIAYLLQKEEIKDITLTVGDSNAQFTKGYNAPEGSPSVEESNDRKDLLGDGVELKKEIIEGAKKVFDDELKKIERR